MDVSQLHYILGAECIIIQCRMWGRKEGEEAIHRRGK